jgi:hypothetical protein
MGTQRAWQVVKSHTGTVKGFQTNLMHLEGSKLEGGQAPACGSSPDPTCRHHGFAVQATSQRLCGAPAFQATSSRVSFPTVCCAGTVQPYVIAQTLWRMANRSGTWLNLL